MRVIAPEDIDALLPQTQCGECGYSGCMPYAEAIVFENAAIDLCPPGGVATLCEIANLVQQDAQPYIKTMQEKEKPYALATIREMECIGCTKCIQACPVDAILGSNKQMHTVIAAECTGCGLCAPPCPVDCIDMLTEVSQPDRSKSAYFRQRFHARQVRLAKEKVQKRMSDPRDALKKKQYVADALARVKAKKIRCRID